MDAVLEITSVNNVIIKTIEASFKAVGKVTHAMRRLNVGPFYVCKDGPVFTAEQLKTLPPEY